MSNENSLQSVRKVTQQEFIGSILNFLFISLHIVYTNIPFMGKRIKILLHF